VEDELKERKRVLLKGKEAEGEKFARRLSKRKRPSKGHQSRGENDSKFRRKKKGPPRC